MDGGDRLRARGFGCVRTSVLKKSEPRPSYGRGSDVCDSGGADLRINAVRGVRHRGSPEVGGAGPRGRQGQPVRRQRSKGRIASAGVAVIYAMGALSGQARAAGDADPYLFDAHARTVTGAAVSTDAEELNAGSVYRSTIKPGAQLYYQVDLDATSNAYVSAVAVPGLGPQLTAGYSDGIKVTLEDSRGSTCGYEDNAVFGAAQYPRPLAAYASRTVGGNSVSCRQAGPYYVLIERETSANSAQGNWGLEIRFDTEPGLESGADSPTQAPTRWPSAPPVPPGGAGERTRGGTGFNDAAKLDSGVWVDRIEPGQTLFYRVPVGWDSSSSPIPILAAPRARALSGAPLPCVCTTRFVAVSPWGAPPMTGSRSWPSWTRWRRSPTRTGTA